MLKKTFLVTLLFAVTNGVVQTETPTGQVARQFCEYCLHGRTDHGERLLDDVGLPKTSPGQTARLLATLQAGGSWWDVDYASKSRSSWRRCTHQTRTLGLVVYARRADMSADERAKYIAAAHRAIP